MAQLRKNPEKVGSSGLSGATYHSDFTTAGSNSYLVKNNGRMLLHFKKTGAGNCDLIIITPQTVDGLAVADRTITIPATTGDVFVALPPLYNNSNQDIEFTLSEVTGLTGAILQI